MAGSKKSKLKKNLKIKTDFEIVFVECLFEQCQLVHQRDKQAHVIAFHHSVDKTLLLTPRTTKHLSKVA